MPSTLLTGLADYWNCEETTGKIYDRIGPCHMSVVNGVGSTTGIQGGARSFSSALSQYGTTPDNTRLRATGQSWTWAGWVHFNTAPSASSQTMVHKGDGDTAPGLEYWIYADSSWRLRVSNGTAVTTLVGPLSSAGTHFVVAWYDADALPSPTLNLRIDNGSPTTVAYTGGWNATHGDLKFGARNSGVFLNGWLDEWGFWNDRILTSSEQSELYASGAGNSYPFDGTGPLPPPPPIVPGVGPWYIALTGSATAGGTITDPWDPVTGLSVPDALPGSTIYWREGVYTGEFACNQVGTSGNRIVHRPYPGETVKIDGSLYLNSDWVTVRDFEIYRSVWTGTGATLRTTDSVDAPDIPPYDGVNVSGQNVQVINCIIRDTRQGVVAFAPAVNLEVYGCLIYNTGWVGPNRGYGHCMYLQNSTGNKLINNNIVSGGLSEFGFHCYGKDGALTGFRFNRNIHSLRQWLVGGNTAVDDCVIDDNVVFEPGSVQTSASALRLGYAQDLVSVSATVTNNLICTIYSIYLFTTVVLTGNIFEPYPSIALQQISPPGVPYSHTLTPNTYNAAAQARVKVFPNAYDGERANVFIANPSSASTVSVDLSSVTGLVVGRYYELANCLNPEEGHGFFHGAGSVSVPMTGWSVATPIAHNATTLSNTFPKFGVFLLRKATAPPQPRVIEIEASVDTTLSVPASRDTTLTVEASL